MVERKLRPAPSTLHLLPSRKPVRTGSTDETKLFVLDTNVLMHDPTSLFRFEEHDIYLPMLTLEELDAHKKGMTEVARNARQASRFLDELVTTYAGPGTEGIVNGIPLSEKSSGAATGRLAAIPSITRFSVMITSLWIRWIKRRRSFSKPSNASWTIRIFWRAAIKSLCCATMPRKWPAKRRAPRASRESKTSY